MAAGNIWEEILARISGKVNTHTFYKWFRPTSFVADTDGSITVRVPELQFKDWLSRHYSGVVSEALREVGRGSSVVSYVIDTDEQLPDRRHHEPDFEEGEGRPVPSSRPDGLNPRYTFDTFIVGPSNQFAHAACRAVAEAPSRAYNPLYIYGGVGLGKTHLMHAVGHYVLQHATDQKLTYISTERFMNEMINAVRYDRMMEFRERFGRWTCCWWMTSSFSPEKKAPRPSFFTPSTRSTTPESRSS